MGACIKHCVCSDSEFERRTLGSQVSERALREIYKLPFQMAIHQVEPRAVMSAYNEVNGRQCNEEPDLLFDVLKDAWEFDGAGVSN